MEITPLAIPDVKVIRPKKFGDHRGFFVETYNRRRLAECDINAEFVQDNHSLSASVGTVRGLHWQVPPFAQAKLVRVLKGRILDVAVDLRRESPTFGHYVSAELTCEACEMMYVPTGFAHGFATLTPSVEVAYKVTNYYSPEHERAVRWNDPKLAIAWGFDIDQATLSVKDQSAPGWNDVKDFF